MSEDERYMQMALQVAELGNGQTSPNPQVGCVIVKDGYVAGQGAHLRAGGPHAEVHALRMAGEAAIGSTVYVTLEPCSHYGRTPPCADALIEAGVSRVVVASLDENPQVAGKGIAKLRAAGIAVDTGVLEAKARKVNEAFFHRIQTGRAFLHWKCAATLDGYIATQTMDSRYVTGEAARHSVQDLRRAYPAIMVGVGTVLADNPQLTLRCMTGEPVDASRQPIRVIVDSQLRTPPDARLLQEPGRTRIYTTRQEDTDVAERRAERLAERLREAGAEVVTIAVESESTPGQVNGRVDLRAVLQDLAAIGVNGVFCEGGATLVSSLLKAQLIDKVSYYVAPKLLGGGVASLSDLGLERMSQAIKLADVEWRQVGDDICVEGYPVYGVKPHDSKMDGRDARVHGFG